jgi:hypothetical protein
MAEGRACPGAAPKRAPRAGKSESKKERILGLWRTGMRDLSWIARDLGSKPSYVASVLRGAGHLRHYQDLYTSPSEDVNVYLPELRGRLGFRTVEVSRRSVELLEQAFIRYGEERDRAGQHQCMVAALTMANRARFCGKLAEAEPFRRWLLRHLAIKGQEIEGAAWREAG